MCNNACINFVKSGINEEDIKGKSVIEVGSRDVGGSLRPTVEAFYPASYIGIDIEAGPGVDQICDAAEILDRFGRESFDVLVSTEMIEHVRDWRKVISNFKHVLKPNGILLISTRSRSFEYHGYPFDFWRYELDDMRVIFSDFIIEKMETDPVIPGVFLKARKPTTFSERDITNCILYSIITGKRVIDISDIEIGIFKLYFPILLFLRAVCPKPFRTIIKKMLGKHKEWFTERISDWKK